MVQVSVIALRPTYSLWDDYSERAAKIEKTARDEYERKLSMYLGGLLK